MTYYSIPKENVARNYCYNINDDNSSVNKQSMKEISTSNKGSSSSSSSSYEVDHSNDIFDAPMLLNENLIKQVSNFIETIGKKSLKSQDDKESKRDDDDDDDESGSFESQDDNESERGDDDSLDCSDDDI